MLRVVAPADDEPLGDAMAPPFPGGTSEDAAPPVPVVPESPTVLGSTQ
jgi:hypothetical protein